MARKQESFSSLFVVATNTESILSCDDSIDFDYTIIPCEKFAQTHVSIISEEIQSMISDWDACDLSSSEHEKPSFASCSLITEHSRNGTVNSVPDSTNGIDFEPLRRIPSSMLPLTLSPPVTFRRSAKRPSGAQSKNPTARFEN